MELLPVFLGVALTVALAVNELLLGLVICGPHADLKSAGHTGVLEEDVLVVVGVHLVDLGPDGVGVRDVASAAAELNLHDACCVGVAELLSDCLFRSE